MVDRKTNKFISGWLTSQKQRKHIFNGGKL